MFLVERHEQSSIQHNSCFKPFQTCPEERSPGFNYPGIWEKVQFKKSQATLVEEVSGKAGDGLSNSPASCPYIELAKQTWEKTSC